MAYILTFDAAYRKPLFAQVGDGSSAGIVSGCIQVMKRRSLPSELAPTGRSRKRSPLPAVVSAKDLSPTEIDSSARIDSLSSSSFSLFRRLHFQAATKTSAGF